MEKSEEPGRVPESNNDAAPPRDPRASAGAAGAAAVASKGLDTSKQPYKSLPAVTGAGRIKAYDRRRAESGKALEGVRAELARLDAAERDYLEEGSLLLELASRAYDLWLAQPASEKRRLVNLVLLNCVWKDGVLSAEYRQPFDLLAVAAAEGEGAALGGGASGASRPGWYP